MDPERLSQMLTAYFTRLTRHIYDEEGTVIKFLGDGLMAVWGVPLSDRQHAVRAVRAAWRMVEPSGVSAQPDELRTRIGINTGPVLAGNLGSTYRFDYTVIGAATNLASRLEGLNKVLGTSLLITESTRSQLGDEFRLRKIGRFLLRGMTRPVTVFEVIGPPEPGTAAPDFVASFEEALEAMGVGDAARAETGFRRTLEGRGGRDGPAEFYLRRLANRRESRDPAEAADLVDLRGG
jgi:adenylate cyclase